MTAQRTRFFVITDRSALLIEARSNVGPIAFGTTAIDGHIDTVVDRGLIDVDLMPSATLSIELSTLRSNNKLYDAELLRRINARHYPTTSLELTDATRIGESNRYLLQGCMTFHGVKAPITGTVGISQADNGNVLIEGEHVFDIRDYDIVPPNVLMLKIYPDVRVQLQLEVKPLGMGS